MRAKTTKVGIAGTHSTGKSTFLKQLCKELKSLGLSVNVVNSLAVAARDAGFPILQEQNEDTALWIMSEGIRLETEAKLSADIVLVDRPIFDAIGYLKAASIIGDRSLNVERLRMLEDIAISYSSDYSFLVLTELDKSVPIGEGRDLDAKFRELAGEQILDFAETNDLNFSLLNQENKDRVVAEILHSICSELNDS